MAAKKDAPIRMPDIYIGGDKNTLSKRKVGKNKVKGPTKYKPTEKDKSRYFAATKVV